MPKLKIPETGRVECRVHIKPYTSSLMEPVDFKIDTGADFSTISKSTLHTLGYNNCWIDKNKQPMASSTTVASGEKVISYFIKLPIINVYGIEGIDYPFGILIDKEEVLPKPSCEGCEFTKSKKLDYRSLLGNDILSCFKVEIDWSSKTLDLNPQNNLDFRNDKYPDKQLNFVETDN